MLLSINIIKIGINVILLHPQKITLIYNRNTIKMFVYIGTIMYCWDSKVAITIAHALFYSRPLCYKYYLLK